jgi:uncharacterized protein
MSGSVNSAEAAAPWWREPWPWILMSGPAAVIVAGLATAWVAWSGADGLVAEDYYKRGLAINRVIEREAAAARAGLEAEIGLNDAGLRLRFPAGAGPQVVFVSFAHATRAGYDQRIRLERSHAGDYVANAPTLARGRWHVAIEDAQASWRIAGDWDGQSALIRLGAQARH